jgi:predicted ATPase
MTTKWIVLTLIVLYTAVGNGQTVNTKTITIEPYLTFQHYEHFKRLILNSPDSDAEYIDGFVFRWGYTYTLKVKETRLISPMSDGTRYQYALVKVISETKEPDTAQFRLLIDAKRYYHEVDSTENGINSTLRQINDSTFSYFDEVEIQVPQLLLEAFRLIAEGKAIGLGSFVYIDERRIRLVQLH